MSKAKQVRAIRVQRGDCVMLYSDRFGVVMFGPIRTYTRNRVDKMTIHLDQEVSWSITATPPKAKAKKGKKK